MSRHPSSPSRAMNRAASVRTLIVQRNKIKHNMDDWR
jgi:hypothetical protein